MEKDGSSGNSREVERFAQLSVSRALAGKPSQQEVAETLSKYREIIKSSFRSNGVSPNLLDLTRHTNGVSRALLCSRSLDKWVDDNFFMDMAMKTEEKGKIPEFRLFFDAGMGFQMALTPIRYAESKRGSAGGSTRSKLTSLAGRVLGHFEDQKAKDNQLPKEYAARSLRLLAKDPSGFLSLDNTIEAIKSEQAFYVAPHLAKEYVLFGAELARDLYKEAYRILEPLYPQKSPKK